MENQFPKMLQGYFNNKVAVPNQNNIQSEYYVEPQDEPNE